MRMMLAAAAAIMVAIRCLPFRYRKLAEMTIRPIVRQNQSAFGLYSAACILRQSPVQITCSPYSVMSMSRFFMMFRSGFIYY